MFLNYRERSLLWSKQRQYLKSLPKVDMVAVRGTQQLFSSITMKRFFWQRMATQRGAQFILFQSFACTNWSSHLLKNHEMTQYQEMWDHSKQLLPVAFLTPLPIDQKSWCPTQHLKQTISKQRHWEIVVNSPWTNTLCSYNAIKDPNVRGVRMEYMMELVGLFPENTLWGNKSSSAFPESPLFSNSDWTSAWKNLRISRNFKNIILTAVFPFINASDWAKKLDRRIVWWSIGNGFRVCVPANKSAGTSFVPWWISYKKRVSPSHKNLFFSTW